MTLEEIYQNYAFNDGKVLSLNIEFASQLGEETGNKVTIVLKVRKHIKKQQFESCKVLLEFTRTTEIDICEDFRTNGGYSDIVLTRLANGQFYLSVDPYGNTGEPSEKDNFVIKGEKLVFIDGDIKNIIS